MGRPGVYLDKSLGEIMKENSHVHIQQTRFRSCGRSPESSELIRQDGSTESLLNRPPASIQSRLGRQGLCPVRHFAVRVLRIQQPKPCSAPSIGNLAPDVFWK